MRIPQLVTVAVTTDGSGNFTTEINAVGRLLQYRYVPGGSPIDTGGDISLVGAKTGFVFINQANIGTAAFQKLPRFATHDEQGVASLYAAGGEPVEDKMLAAGEPLTFSVAQGTAAKTGTFYFWFG